MLRFYCLAICLVTYPLFAQITDNFSDGDFRVNPTWTGDTSKFTVVNEMLWLDGPSISDTSFLITYSEISLVAEWSILIQLDFNPSSTNYVKIVVMSDKPDVKNTWKGYFIKAGGGQDDISLYRQDGNKEGRIIDGPDNRLNTPLCKFRIKLIRDSLFNFHLSCDTSGGTNYKTEGKATDSTYKQGKFFGILCKYTSSRSDKFGFDDIFINGESYQDMTKPRVISDDISNDGTWTIRFSEKVLTTLPIASQWALNFKATLSSLLIDTSSTEFQLKFDHTLPHGKELHLLIDSVTDLSGNPIDPVVLTDVYNHFDSIRFKEVLINEIMPDPEPSAGLPKTEYIELFNRGGAIIKLDLWKLSDAKDTTFLGPHTLNPGDYSLLIDLSDTVLWKNFEAFIIPVKLPALNNDGDKLYLISPHGKVIDSMSYSSKQFPQIKERGGLSLELVSPNFICTDTSNWKVSQELQGGSPGYINSRFIENPVIEQIEFTGVSRINGRVLDLALTGFPRQDSFTKDNFKPLTDLALESLALKSGNLEMTFTDNFICNRSYDLRFGPVSDCLERKSDFVEQIFTAPCQPEPGDLKISEILFNPVSGGKDFIELFNSSEKTFDLSQLEIFKDSSLHYRLKESFKAFFPGDYLAFTEDTADISFRFRNASRKNLVQCPLPVMPDKEGSVLISDTKGKIIDALDYHESMHFEMLKEKEGVSLERISFMTASNRFDNWTSASSTSGYGTPGKQNSQFIEGNNSHFLLIPDIFSPDNDGYNDIVMITYHLNNAGQSGNMVIYDKNGSKVKEVLRNGILGIQGQCFWDGLDEAGNKMTPGYYIVVFNHISSKGEVYSEKASVVIANMFK